MILWSWLEYEFRSGKKGQLKFVILTGVFTGAAILVKWLPGLLVYCGWGLAIITSRTARKKIKSYLHLLLGLLITVVVSLPWQIYILTRFPLESKVEFQSFYNHFTQPLDGHNGDGLGWHYYLSNFSDIFSVSLLTWILLSVIFLLIINRKPIGYGMLGMVVIVFTFYSFAATKMPAFTFITLPIILLVYASLFTIIERLFAMFVPSRFLQILLMTVIIINVAASHYRLNEKYSDFYPEQGNTERCILQREKFAGLYRELGTIIPESQQSRFIIINCPDLEIPHLMFYTTIRAAYDKITDNQLRVLKSRKDLKIGYIVISDEPIPENILRDDSILKIRFSKDISVKDLGQCL
jgi:4-amino-4-deoxy-L-arabinose transferase